MTIASHLAADLTLQSFRAADAFSAFLAGVEANRERREERRQAGVDSVSELAARLREARSTEAAAIRAAQALADENESLRAELAAARRAAALQAQRAVRAEAVISRTADAIRVAARSHAA